MAIVEPRIRAQRQTLTKDRYTLRIAGAAMTLLFGVTAAINLGALATGASLLPKTHLAAAVLSLYLLLEARLFLRRSDGFGLLSPVLMALVFHFFLSYLAGITVAVFQPWTMERFGYWLSDLDTALAGTMLLAMLAAFCMLRGYALAQPTARRLRRAVERMPHIRSQIRPDLALVIGMQIIYIALVAYAIGLGAYGLLSTAETRSQHADIQQFLNLGLSAGTLSYFLILLHYFRRRAERRAGSLDGVLVAVLIVLHVFAGALAAFKSQIVFPFVIAGFAYFLATRRMPLRFVGFAVVALIMAYAVIEPFRAYLGGREQPPASIVEAVEVFGAALDSRAELTHVSDISRTEAIASRFDLAGMTALAVDYVDRGQLQAHQRHEFQDSILLAPILAYVPRAIWQDKPSYSPGVWFNQNVRGRWNDESTSVGMGPIGYLYMVGGVTGVVLGFLGFGILQALIFNGVGRAGAGGLIIYLSVANTLVMIPTSFGPAVTGVLRMLPVAFVAQLILLRRGPAPRRNAR